MTTILDPLCEACRSTGILDKAPCPHCGGTGRVSPPKSKKTKPAEEG